MKNYLKLYDAALLRPVQFTDQNRLYFKDNAETAEVKSSLVVRVAASHAGRLTANNAFYHPKKMLNDMASFTTPYHKPFLLNHDLEGDPLGRVFSTRYVDLSAPYVSQLKLQDYLRQDAKKKIARLPDGLMQELLNPKFEGLGYLEVTANITDEKAIEKIADGRYKTVSVAFITDAAVCSICHQDWIADGKCDHTPGEMVDGKPVFIIVGNIRYDEISFVNRPADNLAGVMEFVRGGISDKVNVPLRHLHEVVYDAYVSAPQTLINVTDPKGINLAQYQDQFQEVLTLMTINKSAPVADKDVQAILDKLLADASLEVTSLADMNMIVRLHNFLHEQYDWYVNSDGKTDRVPKDQIALHAKLHIAAMEGKFVDSFILGDLDKTLEDEGVTMPASQDDQEDGKQAGAVKDEEKDKVASEDEEDLPDIEELFDEEKCYELMAAELDAMAVEADDVKDSKGAQSCRDAKLSAEQRKNLKPSTFCGPNKSFPVPDCPHVTAARRLISRYQGPGKKDAILACVNRKAKALGCDGKKADEGDACGGKKTKDELLEQRQALLDQLQAVDAELQSRFDFSPDPCPDCVSKAAEIVSLKAASFIDMDQLDALELDLQASQQEVADLTEQLVAARAQMILDRRQLSNRKPLNDEELKAEMDILKVRSLESLQNTLQDLDKQAPMTELLKPLTDGMGHTPTEGAVADPTAAAEITKDLKADDAALKRQIMQKFNQVSRMHGSKTAESYLKDMHKLYPQLHLADLSQL